MSSSPFNVRAQQAGDDGDQLDLFGPRLGLLCADAPDTSQAAARSVMPRTGTQRRAVYNVIARSGEVGVTDLELQTHLELPGNSERPRRVELLRDGLVRDSGRRRAGHIVWIAS